MAAASRFASLLPAIFFHQVFEGLALGVRLADLARRQQIISPATDGPPRRLLPRILSFLFALPVPLILLITFAATSHQSREPFPTPSSLFNTIPGSPYPPISQPGVAFQGVTSAISAGLLIYVSCVELLAEDFVHDTDMQREMPIWKQVSAVVALVLGALGMCFVG